MGRLECTLGAICESGSRARSEFRRIRCVVWSNQCKRQPARLQQVQTIVCRRSEAVGAEDSYFRRVWVVRLDAFAGERSEIPCSKFPRSLTKLDVHDPPQQPRRARLLRPGGALRVTPTVRALEIAVIGCGTAGPAAAVLLARAGHAVTAFERVAEPVPVGAGILLQPSGMVALARLGLLEELVAVGAPVRRLHGITHRGRTVLDLRYGRLDPLLIGLGLQRGALFSRLYSALGLAGVTVLTDRSIERIRAAGDRATLADERGRSYGPFDLVVVADGARSLLRRRSGLVRRAHQYPWGAVWAMVPGAEGQFEDTLFQVYRGAARMVGFLPSGRAEPGNSTPRTSIFWSLRAEDLRSWRERGLEGWKREVLGLWPRAEPLLAQLRDSDELAFAPYYDVRMRRWHEGPTVFIGDSGHAMSPQLGQGANLALCDALVLADCLAQHAELGIALRRYSRLRRRQLRYYQWASRWLTPFFQSQLAPLGWLRDALLGPLSRGPLSRLMLTTLAGLRSGLLRSRSIAPVVETLRPALGAIDAPALPPRKG